MLPWALPLEAGDAEPADAAALAAKLRSGVQMAFELKRLPPLFADRAEYDAFRARHDRAQVHKVALHPGRCFLGIDAGSTTTKLALIDEDGALLWSFYANNQGSPVQTAMHAMRLLGEQLPPGAEIARSCSTGYGETLLKSAFLLR